MPTILTGLEKARAIQTDGYPIKSVAVQSDEGEYAAPYCEYSPLTAINAQFSTVIDDPDHPGEKAYVGTVPYRNDNWFKDAKGYVGTSVRTRGLVTGKANGGFFLQWERGTGNPDKPDAVFVKVAGQTNLRDGDLVTVAGEVAIALVENRFTKQAEEDSLPYLVIEAKQADISVLQERAQYNGPTPEAVMLGGDGFVLDPKDSRRASLQAQLLHGRRVHMKRFIATQPSMYGQTYGYANGTPVDVVDVNQEGIAVESANKPLTNIIALRLWGRILRDDNGDVIVDADGHACREKIETTVGDTLEGERGGITGVMVFENSAELVVRPCHPLVATGRVHVDSFPEIHKGPRDLVFMSFNTWNLMPEKIEQGGRIAADMSPIPLDLAVLQEVQDNDGRTNSGTVSADATLAMLEGQRKRVAEEVGTSYSPMQWIDRDPVNNQDGGEPGGNIRNVFGVTQALEVVSDYRLGADSEAFLRTRKPYVGHFKARDTDLEFTMVNVHNSSKHGGTARLGVIQPPRIGSRERRLEQVEVILAHVEELLREHPQRPVFLMGDFNASLNDDSVQALGQSPGCWKIFSDDSDVSILFQGRGQCFEHVIVFASEQFRESQPGFLDRVEVHHITNNLRRPEKMRSSDHGQAVVVLRAEDS
ncbi:MAG: hypothetical protein A2341_09690 [Deltaproteobacteria bacterium RIFOXYB12_FULL_58_9]|nr:MAG: hypothetical protein A2341_09690 [Deltaproteobacteria bacterium RIFOXYB12_FULL_58_9]